MTAADIATAGFIDQHFRAIHARLDHLTPALPAPPAEVVLYSYRRLAAVLDVRVETVSSWVNKGKVVSGRTIKLQAFKFTSEPRVPWPALLAYERGEIFDLSTLPAPTRAPDSEPGNSQPGRCAHCGASLSRMPALGQ